MPEKKSTLFTEIQDVNGNVGFVLRTEKAFGKFVKLSLVNESGGIEVMPVASDFSNIKVVKDGLKASYFGDFNKLSLFFEANRILKPDVSDPFTALNTSPIIPLPHQLNAVYNILLPMNPIRFLLADDPGAGKTIMSGLLIKELLFRRRIRSVLVVSPGGLSNQWKKELLNKFGLDFEMLDGGLAVKDKNYFSNHPFLISKLDILARNDQLKLVVENNHFDLTIIDEAHKLSASFFGDKVKYTKRFKLGRILSKNSTDLLLLTATPHDGKPEDFRMLMSLINPFRFPENGAPLTQSDLKGVIRRVVKEEMVNFDGTHLFPERSTGQCFYQLRGKELDLYNDVTDYVKNQYNKAQRLDKKAVNCIGFVMTLLQRRLASSPYAILVSLRRRLEKLKERFDCDSLSLVSPSFDSSELNEGKEELLQGETAAINKEELGEEIQTLENLVKEAEDVLQSCKDTKWLALSGLLEKDFVRPDEKGKYPKLIIFTESADTLQYLKQKIEAVLGGGRTISIQGGMTEAQRQRAEDTFWHDGYCQILLATDAANEGLNLQCAHYLVNYDLPWNPNRLEQRFGRIHRIGQKQKCYMFNLISTNTREGKVFATLMSKIEEERKALGPQVYNVLGNMTFDGKTLAEVLKEIVLGNVPLPNYGYLKADVPELKAIIDDNNRLNTDVSIGQAKELMLEVSNRRSDKIEPFVLRNFVISTLNLFNCPVISLDDGTFKIPVISPFILSENSALPTAYDHVVFDSSLERKGGEFVGISHPLIKAICLAVIHSMKSKDFSALAYNPTDYSSQPYFVLCSRVKIDCNKSKEQRNLYDNYGFYRLKKDGVPERMDISPYLDYQPVSKDDLDKMALGLMEQRSSLIEQEGKLLTQVRQMENKEIEGVLQNTLKNSKRDLLEQQKGLGRQINNLDFQIIQMEKKKDMDEEDKRRLEDKRRESSYLKSQLNALKSNEVRPADFICQKDERIPSILVIPRGFIDQCATSDLSGDELKKKNEEEAIKTILEMEKSLGFLPLDKGSVRGTGYDIISRGKDGEGNAVTRRIEVKGMEIKDSILYATRNEINRSLNNAPETYLAVVKIENGKGKIVEYIRNPFKKILERQGVQKGLDESLAVIGFNVKDIEEDGEIVLKKQIGSGGLENGRNKETNRGGDPSR